MHNVTNNENGMMTLYCTFSARGSKVFWKDLQKYYNHNATNNFNSIIALHCAFSPSGYMVHQVVQRQNQNETNN